jgi:hypothetical protein
MITTIRRAASLGLGTMWRSTPRPRSHDGSCPLLFLGMLLMVCPK